MSANRVNDDTNLPQQGDPSSFCLPVVRQQAFQPTNEIDLHAPKGRPMAGTRTGERVARRRGDSLAQTEDERNEVVNRFRSHLRAAIDASGVKHSVIARDIRVTERHLSKMLAMSGDQKTIGIHHLVALPAAVRQALIVRIATKVGLMDTLTVTMHVSPRLVGVATGLIAAMTPHGGFK